MASGTTTAVIPYIRVAAHLALRRGRDLPALHETTRALLPVRLRKTLDRVPVAEWARARRDPAANARSYRALCGVLLRVILIRDGWRLHGGVRSPGPAGVAQPIFRGERGGRRIEFYFLDQRAARLTPALRRLARRDGGAFRELAVVVAPTPEARDRVRRDHQAARFPRVFFASFPEIRATAALVAPAEYAAICGPVDDPLLDGVDHTVPGNVVAFPAEVTANKPVGGPSTAYYILTFLAPRIEEVWPSQFVMMDVSPARQFLRPRVVRTGGLRLGGAVDLAPWPVLKRPFAIQRAFYRYFNQDFLRHLALPPSLSLGLHPVFPHRFDMLYKVLPSGVGTPLMTRLRRGQRVHMLGPLGRPFDVRHLRARGVEEVHVIGGGVGVAPLILLVQQLRYHAFRVKVFIGISKLQSLRYRGDIDPSFAEEPGNAYVYVDDVLEAGVAPADIYLACDSERPARGMRGIPRRNLFFGFVTDQYRRFLAAQPTPRRGSVTAVTCGPDRMMELIWEIAREARLPLKVLMEKRMACGIGVCLSCVCKVRRPDGSEDYSRVCTEGPVFEASDIIWKPNDSKSASEACGSVRRC